MRPAVTHAVEELEKMNVRLSLRNGKVHVRYSCPRTAVPVVMSAIGILKEHREETIALLSERTKAMPKNNDWPLASFEAQAKFLQLEARLYPFIDKRVRTPRGTGQLRQVFDGRATVLLDSELAKPGHEQKESYFDPADVFPWRVM